MTIQFRDVLEVSARSEFQGVEDIVNVYQFENQTSPSVPDEDGVDDLITFLETVYTIWRGFQTILVLFRDLRVRNVTQNVQLGVFPWPTLSAGASASNALPPGNAGLINFTTSVSRVTPRKYMGGITSASLESDGALESATVAGLVSISALLLAPIIEASSSWLYGYLSPKTASFEVPVSATITDISAYQRRRKQGRGS